MNEPTMLERLSSPRREPDPQRLAGVVAGQTVLVTGASYGLGEATAIKLGAAGAKVLLIARTGERLDEVAMRIRTGGGSAFPYQVDLTDPQSTDAAVDALLAEHGAPDVVVNNAGKSIRRSLALQYDRPQDFDRTMGVNYLGPVRMLLRLLPAMADAGGGQVINISTIGVRVAPGPRWGAYQASKGAMDIWLRSIAPELRRDRIAITSIYMALIHTRMSAPSPSIRRLKGFTPEQAADVVAAALIRRPRRIAPWWSWPVEVLGAVLGSSIDPVLSVVDRMSRDSTSARGQLEVNR